MSDLDRKQSLSSVHEEMRELIPWYVNGTLSGTEKRAISEHLDFCLACRGELNFQREMAQLVQADDCARETVKFNFRNLRNRINQGEILQLDSTTVTEKPGFYANAASYVKHFRYPAMAAAAVIVIATTGLNLYWQAPGQIFSDSSTGFQTLSSSSPLSTRSNDDIFVVFQPGTTDATISEIFTQYRIEIVNRSEEQQLWRIRLTDKDSDEGVLATTIWELKSNENILFIAQVIPGE